MIIQLRPEIVFQALIATLSVAAYCNDHILFNSILILIIFFIFSSRIQDFCDSISKLYFT